MIRWRKPYSSTHFQIYLTLVFLLFTLGGLGQIDSTKVSESRRLRATALGSGVIAAGTLSGLYFLWYADYPQSRFHFFKDGKQWLQMDKAGHAMTTFAISEGCFHLFQGTGLSKSRVITTSALLGLGYQTAIEVMDGFSAEWGFSPGDMAANAFGASLFTAQQMAWDEQRIRLKFSFTPSIYADYRPELLGSSLREQVFKDYNGQTYWLTWNPNEFNLWSAWPAWLDIAMGYGANGMTGGSFNAPGTPETSAFERERQYYLSLDIDLYALPAKRTWFKVLRTAFGYIKIPAPALVYGSKNGWDASFLSF